MGNLPGAGALPSSEGKVIVAPSSMHPLLSQIHKLSFIAWFGVTTIHVVGHLKDTVTFAPRDAIRRTRRQVRGASQRAWTTLASLALGVVCAWAIAPYVTNGAHFGH